MRKVTILMALVLALVPGALFANDTLGGELLAPVQSVEPEGPTFKMVGGVTLISEAITDFGYDIEISEQPDRCYVVTAQLADEVLQAKRVSNGVETMENVLNADGAPMTMQQMASFGTVTFTPSDWGPQRMQVTGKWEDSKHISQFLELKVEHLMESKGWNDPLCDGPVLDEPAVIPSSYDLFTVWDNDQPGVAIEKTDDAALTYRVKLTSQPQGLSVTVTPDIDAKGGTWGDAPAPLTFTQDNWDQYQTVSAPLLCGNGDATFSHATSGLGFDDVKASYLPTARALKYVDGLYINNIEAVRTNHDTIVYSYYMNAVTKRTHDINFDIIVHLKDDPDNDPEQFIALERLSRHDQGSIRVVMRLDDILQLGEVRHVIDLNGGSYCDYADGDELPTFTFPHVD